jgi:hypothetical protein
MPTKLYRTARYRSLVLLATVSGLVLCAAQQAAVAQQSSTYYLNLSKVDFPPEALINSTFYVSGLLNYSLPPPIAQSTGASKWFIAARAYNTTISPPPSGTFLAMSDPQAVSGTGTIPFRLRLSAAAYQTRMGITLYAMYQPSPSFSGLQLASGPQSGAWRYTLAPTSMLDVWIKTSPTGHIAFSASIRLRVPVTIDSYLYETNLSGQLLVNVTGLQWHLITIPATISLAPGQRALFIHWQDGTNFTTRNLYMDQDRILVATYKIQFFLTVDKNSGSGWYDNGSIAQLTADRGKQNNGVMALIGFEPVFTGWTGDVTTTNSTVQIPMNGAHVTTAVWKTEFRPSPLKLAAMIMAAVIALATLYKVGHMLYALSKHKE